MSTGEKPHPEPPVPMTRAKLVGEWRIVDMELWEADAIDLVGPAFIEFQRDGGGSFRFIAVEGWMDVRPADHLGPTGVEFSWDGEDEMDHASGRGWARLTDEGELMGRIYLHMGDDSSFRAVRT